MTVSVFIVATGLAQASDFDGSKRLVCAPADVFECGPAFDCQRVTAEVVNIPRFIRVDVKKKTLVGAIPGASEERTTTIQNIQKIDGKTILQGAENGRGWTMIIDQATGHMSATMVDNLEGFVLFGACMVK
jgi:hypothetical protein